MNNIEKQVLELIGENIDNPDIFTDDSFGMAQIRDSINDGIEEIALVTGAYRDRYFLPLRAGRAFYRFDYKEGSIAWVSNAFLMVNQWRLEHTDLMKLRTFNPRFLYDSGVPRSYYPIGQDFIGLWPTPGSDGDILEIHAVIIPRRYSLDTDEVFVKQDYEYAAVQYAVGEYWASRGDVQSAIEHHNRYMQMIGLELPTENDYRFQMKSSKEPWPRKTG